MYRNQLLPVQKFILNLTLTALWLTKQSSFFLILHSLKSGFKLPMRIGNQVN